ALLQLLCLLLVPLLQLLLLLLMTLLQVLPALCVGIAPFHFLLFLRLLLLHTLAFGVLLLAQFVLVPLLPFHQSRVNSVRIRAICIRRTIIIPPRIFRGPIFRLVHVHSIVAAIFGRTICVVVAERRRSVAVPYFGWPRSRQNVRPAMVHISEQV